MVIYRLIGNYDLKSIVELTMKKGRYSNLEIYRKDASLITTYLHDGHHQ